MKVSFFKLTEAVCVIPDTNINSVNLNVKK